MMGFGIGLLAGIASVLPYLYRHSLHNRWGTFGKNILLSSMFLPCAFLSVAGIRYGTC